MTEASPMSKPAISPDIDKFTCLPGLPDGRLLFNWQNGLRPDQSSLVLVPVLPSPSPAKKRNAHIARALALSGVLDELATQYARTAATLGLPMPAIYGRRLGDSSPSCVLQSALESRSRAKMASYGSPEYEVRWRYSDMLLGPRIGRLAASARRTSDRDCSGWPTPNTPSGGRSVGIDKMSATGITEDGRKHTVSLEHVAKFSGWPTPMAGTPAQNGYDEAGNNDSSRKTVALVSSWATPTGRDYKSNEGSEAFYLERLTQSRGKPLAEQANQLGLMPSGSPASTGKRGALNPAFSRWLQGFPEAWCEAAITAHRSIQTTRRKRG